MQKIKFFICGLALLVCSTTFAQKGKSPSFSIGVEAGLPVGKDLKEGWNFGIGGSAKVGIPLFEGGDVTLSAGYISFLGKSESFGGVTVKNKALSTIPLKAGLRFMLGQGFYGEPQLGYTIAKVSGLSGNLNGFTYAAGIGYMASQVDIGVRYEAWSKTENNVTANPSFIGLRLGFNLGR